MTVLPIAVFSPDQPDYPAVTSDVVFNVLPRTSASYGPWPGLTPQSSALTARCQGAYSMQDTAGNVYNYAGDATKLYEEGPGTTTFSNVSDATYSTASTERWSFTQFSPKVIATNFADVPKSLTPGGGNFATLITSGMTTLKARYVTTVKDWVVFANTFDGTDSNQPQRVWWGAEGDPTNVPTPGTAAAAAVQSDYQNLVGDAGWIMGVVGNLGTADGAVFQERAVTRMVYVGPPAIFAFSTAEGARGCPAPGSIAQLGSVVFYLGTDGFYAFDGSNSKPIGHERVDLFFFADVDQSLFHRVTAAIDPQRKLYLIAYPQSGANNCNRILAYNWALDRWSITAADAVTVEVLFRSLTLGYSVETLDNIGTNIDSDPPFTLSLDDRYYTGGQLQMSCFDASHKLNYFSGSNLAATVDTSTGQLFPGKRARVTRVRPLVDGGVPSIAIGTLDVLTGTKSYSTAVAVGASGDCPVRVDGRYHTGRITIPAASTWSHITGIDLTEYQSLGVR